MSTQATDSFGLSLKQLGKKGHSGHSVRCMQGLPSSQVEADTSRMAIGFYALGSLDILGTVNTSTTDVDRQSWIDWIWEQQSSGVYGTGFKGSPYMIGEQDVKPLQLAADYSEFDTPSLIMTYTALLNLAILRDDFTRLERPGLIKFIKACQREDGSFGALPSGGEADLRPLYCAFAISSMINDWSGVDIDKAIAYIRTCESYEGGYGQTPYGEALGGTTYCALASLALASKSPSVTEHISAQHRATTIRWLSSIQQTEGGFSGRTNKIADTCYCFWCGASLELLGAPDVANEAALASFLEKCQFQWGGICKAPETQPDPYHTYMGLATLSIYNITKGNAGVDPSWNLPSLHVSWNVTDETAEWIRKHLSSKAGQ
ncbi:terpenoid cyclases/protein prenyltransferase alpha-alpha toroid [Irpex rosettiformis]|uniref:Terpenoid cyclases/protein prenyltransferase alpha-alpha toroid n=1 Tax=Irpex rosettiformis TaxID=378272 RepID=A0ACB8U3E1_9APHY|nr:terpenoid cyclases/protein prenyltransferase alpha-alpha toroid [Irpex rosettiformis]